MKGTLAAALARFGNILRRWPELQRAWDQVAQLLTGGLVIHSLDEGVGAGATVYARTVIQLDGDVITAWRPGLVGGADWEALSARHLEDVASALKPLQLLALALGRVRKVVTVVSSVGALGSGVWAAYSRDWSAIIALLAAAGLTIVGLALRKIFLCCARRRVRHLWQEAKKEAEERGASQ